MLPPLEYYVAARFEISTVPEQYRALHACTAAALLRINVLSSTEILYSFTILFGTVCFVIFGMKTIRYF